MLIYLLLWWFSVLKVFSGWVSLCIVSLFRVSWHPIADCPKLCWCLVGRPTHYYPSWDRRHKGLHDTRHNDIQHNDILRLRPQHCDTTTQHSAGVSYWRGRLGTVELLVLNSYIENINYLIGKTVFLMRRSTVLNLPSQLVFPALSITMLCHYAEGHYTECHVLYIVMLNVVILSVVAPHRMLMLRLVLKTFWLPFVNNYWHYESNYFTC